MHFPAISPPAEARLPGSVVADPQRGHETVLLVEDEEVVRKTVSAVLRRQGYTVIETATALEACELFGRQGGEIDLLVTDVVMPGMNGPALAQRLVGHQPSLRVLFISGYMGTPAPEMQKVNVSFLNKPFQTSTLASRVREVLNRPRVSGDVPVASRPAFG
jgi:DNA-binding NtrC family response regulator